MVIFGETKEVYPKSYSCVYSIYSIRKNVYGFVFRHHKSASVSFSICPAEFVGSNAFFRGVSYLDICIFREFSELYFLRKGACIGGASSIGFVPCRRDAGGICSAILPCPRRV